MLWCDFGRETNIVYIVYIMSWWWIIVCRNVAAAHPHPNPHADCGAWNETSFTMKTMNKVTWTHTDDATLRLTSDLSMEVSFEKPSWVWVPNSMVRSWLEADSLLPFVLVSASVSVSVYVYACHTPTHQPLPPKHQPPTQMNRVGSLVLKRVVKKALPEFLERIISGYHDWHTAEQLATNGAASAGGGGGGTVV